MTDQERIALLERQVVYLIQHRGVVPAVVIHVDYDPAGDTTEYDPEPQGVELFGKENLEFQVGVGYNRSYYSIRGEGT